VFRWREHKRACILLHKAAVFGTAGLTQMEYHFVATVLVEMDLQGILDLDSFRKGLDRGHR
jgi:hypothetical protein